MEIEISDNEPTFSIEGQLELLIDLVTTKQLNEIYLFRYLKEISDVEDKTKCLIELNNLRVGTNTSICHDRNTDFSDVIFNWTVDIMEVDSPSNRRVEKGIEASLNILKQMMNEKNKKYFITQFKKIETVKHLLSDNLISLISSRSLSK